MKKGLLDTKLFTNQDQILTEIVLTEKVGTLNLKILVPMLLEGISE